MTRSFGSSTILLGRCRIVGAAMVGVCLAVGGVAGRCLGEERPGRKPRRPRRPKRSPPAGEAAGRRQPARPGGSATPRARASQRRVGRVLSVPLPIVSDTDRLVKRFVDRVLDDARKNHYRPVLILQLDVSAGPGAVRPRQPVRRLARTCPIPLQRRTQRRHDRRLHSPLDPGTRRAGRAGLRRDHHGPGRHDRFGGHRRKDDRGLHPRRLPRDRQPPADRAGRIGPGHVGPEPRSARGRDRREPRVRHARGIGRTPPAADHRRPEGGDSQGRAGPVHRRSRRGGSGSSATWPPIGATRPGRWNFRPSRSRKTSRWSRSGERSGSI